MRSIAAQLRAIFADALLAALGEQGRGVDPLIRASADAKFGDYQSNVAMGLAKQVARKPRDVAESLIAVLASNPAFNDMCEKPEIAGPGFINLRLRPDWLNCTLSKIPPSPDAEGDRLGIEPVGESSRDVVVVDYSSPNIAKPMHVGHLRSTIIGDSLARILEFEGHAVVRQNHLGDWGTQMGIILVAFDRLRKKGKVTGALKESFAGTVKVHEFPDLRELEPEYKALNAGIENDPPLRAEVARKLQMLQLAGPVSDEWKDWNYLRDYTIQQLDALYRQLDVSLAGRTRATDVFPRQSSVDQTKNRSQHPTYCGESWYQSDLPWVVKDLRAAPRTPLIEVREDNGALCIFLFDHKGQPAFRGSNGEPLPLIAQKSDGTFLYATTDLAAIRFRVGTLGATRILYVVGAPQRLHFQMFFAAAHALGWTNNAKLEHVAFGSVLGENRKMLRTRSGENVKLRELLDEAVSHAAALVAENDAKRQSDLGQAALSETEKQDIARAVGIGSVKYADLRQDRNSDYVFNWEKMLGMQGNTAPYLMYAYARIRSIFRKGAETGTFDVSAPVRLEHPAELALGKRILQLAETLDAVSDTLYPHVLCDYLYDLAGKFMAFYENCPVMKAPDDATRASRLRLCDLAARTLKLGLGLLGIRTLERM